MCKSLGTVFLIGVLAAGWAAAHAQEEAHMSGQVSGPDGNAVPNAKIRLESKDKGGVAVEAKSKKDGKFLIGMIRPGSYRLVVSTSSDWVLVHVKGKGTDPTDRKVLWELDQDVSAQSPPTINVGNLNQIVVDITVGPPSLTPEAKQETSRQQAQSDYAGALEMVRAGDYAEGLSKLEPLLAGSPDNVQLNYLIAYARHGLGKEKEALDALDKVLAKEPDFAGAHVLKGRILQAEGRNDDAEAEFRREIATTTDKGVRLESWGALAAMFEKTGRLPKAIETLEKAVAEEPRRELLMALADFYAKTGDRQKAEATLERADKEAGGMDDAAMLNLAISYINDKKYDEAERLALRVEGKDSSNPNKSLAHSILARCDLSHGKNTEGIGHLEKALALDPASPLAAENREILAALKKK